MVFLSRLQPFWSLENFLLVQNSEKKPKNNKNSFFYEFRVGEAFLWFENVANDFSHRKTFIRSFWTKIKTIFLKIIAFFKRCTLYEEFTIFGAIFMKIFLIQGQRSVFTVGQCMKSISLIEKTVPIEYFWKKIRLYSAILAKIGEKWEHVFRDAFFKTKNKLAFF